MKLQDLRTPTLDQQIEEMAALFTALGQYQVLLAESQLDEVSAWQPNKQPMSPERRAELKARQQAWLAQQRRMGKLK